MCMIYFQLLIDCVHHNILYNLRSEIYQPSSLPKIKMLLLVKALTFYLYILI